MTKSELAAIVKQHSLWLKCDSSGKRADLRGADLRNVDLLTLAQSSIVPEQGAFEGWKKCQGGVLVRVRIPEAAKRSSATGRKCRAEFVEVLEVVGAEVAIFSHDSVTSYKAGETVECNQWCEDRWIECAGGIHFFLTRIEAENY